MKRLAFFLATIVLITTSCYPPTFFSTNLTYTVTGSATLDTANIIYNDDNGVEQVLTGVSLPATYNFPEYAYTNPRIWAQNTSANFQDTLHVQIDYEGRYHHVWEFGSAQGLNCIVEATSTIKYEKP